MMPDLTGTGIHQPWRELPGTTFLVSSQAGAEISFQRALAAEPLLDPRNLPVPADGEALQGAAHSLLACAQRETLLRVAMHWAFASEVAHRPWAQNRDTLRYLSLSGPAANRHQLQMAPHRLVIPQLVRVIAMDAVYSRSSTGRETDGPSQLSAPVRILVSEFFPSFDRSEPPSHREIRTALWILSHDTPLAEDMTRRNDVLVRHREAILAAARNRRGRRVALVGSVARGNDTHNSDYDFLVDFDDDVSLFDMAGLQVDLEDILGGRVDIVPRSSVKEHCQDMFKDAVAL